MRHLTVLALPLAVLTLAASPAAAHLGRPGYTAAVRTVSPTVAGLDVRILGGDDQLSVTNHTTNAITVLGDEGEPYVRLRPDGAVAVNVNAPSFYRDGGPATAAAVPATASSDATARWQTVATNGTYAWHDRRIRGAAGSWSIPLRVGPRTATIRGTLARAANSDGGGTNPIIFFGPVAFVLAAVLFLARRERRASPTTAEAW